MRCMQSADMAKRHQHRGVRASLLPAKTGMNAGRRLQDQNRLFYRNLSVRGRRWFRELGLGPYVLSRLEDSLDDAGEANIGGQRKLGPLPSMHGELTRAEVFDRSCRRRITRARRTSSGADDLAMRIDLRRRRNSRGIFFH